MRLTREAALEVAEMLRADAERLRTFYFPEIAGNAEAAANAVVLLHDERERLAHVLGWRLISACPPAVGENVQVAVKLGDSLGWHYDVGIWTEREASRGRWTHWRYQTWPDSPEGGAS